jgi:CDP-diacylglycerol--glycerol-3-phosphate 3-phosphatidyltransferase
LTSGLETGNLSRREGEVPRTFLNIPNSLTLFRVASAPLFLFFWFYFTGEDRAIGMWACLVVACVSEASDLLDGQIARWMGQVSNFGKLMDPYADSIFRLTAFLSFASTVDGQAWYPLWMPVLLVLRDIGTSIIRTFAVQQGIVVAAKASGKIKAVAQGFAMIALLVLAISRSRHDMFHGEYFARFSRDATIMMGILIAVAYWALIEHLWAHIAVFRKSATNSD